MRGDIADAPEKVSIARARLPSSWVTVQVSTMKRRAAVPPSFIRRRRKSTEVAQTAREAASRQTGTLTAAIDAGKKAYQEEKRKTEMSGRIEALQTSVDESTN